MKERELDLLEVLRFDEIEETIGTRLRAIIQRLEKHLTAGGVTLCPRLGGFRGNAFLPNAASEASAHMCGYRSMRRATRGDMPVNRRKCRAR
jgi:hypothetical protein